MSVLNVYRLGGRTQTLFCFILLSPLFVLLLYGCSNSDQHSISRPSSIDHDLTHSEIAEIAVERAAALLSRSRDEVHSDYRWRMVEGSSEANITVEFFHMDLVGDKNIESLASMKGGFPLYFWIEFDRKNGVVVFEYYSSE